MVDPMDNTHPPTDDEAEDDNLTIGSLPTGTPSWHSLTDTVARGVHHNGRRYHSFRHGSYPFPNDTEEQDREQMMHYLWVGMLGGNLFRSPIGRNPQKIIDLGTGTGCWAIEVAESYPAAEVVGVDLSPIQPEWSPPNLRFHVDNFEEDWVYGTGFDFVFLRCCGFTMRDPQKVFQSAFSHLRSGGWIELQDLRVDNGAQDGTQPENFVFDRSAQMIRKLYWNAYGFDVELADRLPEELTKAGFINVREEVHHVPVGTWPREEKGRYFGLINREVLLGILEPLSLKPTMDSNLVDLGMDQSDVNALISEIEDTLNNDAIHTYTVYGVVYAQKP